MPHVFHCSCADAADYTPAKLNRRFPLSPSPTLTVQVVVEWVEVLAGVLLVVPVKVELELLTRLHHLLLGALTTL
jgi:hypothetical protein